MKIERYIYNPIFFPNPRIAWEAEGTFNPGVVKVGKKVYMLYRALSYPIKTNVGILKVSSIGLAESKDGINFKNRRFFFGPEYDYEAYGCEDPRITKFKGKYFIFYTAVSKWPPTKEVVKAGLATTEDFNEYEKHGVICPYNSKAMAMFPRKVNDRIAIIFTLYPDYPPSKIAIAYFDSIKELLNPTKEYWREWMKYPEFQENIVMEAIPPRKYVEVGSPPIETDEGWLLIMPDITPEGVFNITAAMLDLEYPNKVIAKLKRPLLIPLAEYEREGNVPNVAFPTGALEKDGEIYIYYGAADKYIALGFIDKEKLVKYLMKEGRI